MAAGEKRDRPSRRRAWRSGPDSSAHARSWLALSDEELLHQIETLDPEVEADLQLLAVVKSSRHFFIRQEAAKRIRHRAALMAYVHDRHIGQILVRRLTRLEDVAYLEDLANNSRHLDVRKAAESQLAVIRSELSVGQESS